MPEIIQFSNQLCYSDTPLIPLRQYGPDRLPPLEHVYVPEGYKEGSGSRVINKPEAEAIMERMNQMCKDSKYKGKTMGVVVLQGEAQGALIENMLLAALGAEEFEKRKIVCGNPYSFQGDERHIIFLSMVAAGDRIGTFTSGADERRFNVAASRAQDQMILIHSVKREDLSAQCLRSRLLEFFESKANNVVQRILLENWRKRITRLITKSNDLQFRLTAGSK
jgi:Superfamily I DNA and RNA helicases and helicase subunits